MEIGVGISVADLSSVLSLGSIRGLGPQVFKAIFDAGLSFQSVLEDPNSLPMKGRRADTIREQILTKYEASEEFILRARRYIAAAETNQSQIVTYQHHAYPKRVLDSNYPVPILFARGATDALNPERAVACVGSRQIRPPFSDRQDEFARYAAEAAFSVVSGFALGADSIAHRASFETGGNTVCVMPSGLDRPFPPENREFWRQLLDYPKAVFVSESPFGSLASSLSLRKRNKLILSFAQGVLVGQSSNRGGAMNAYRFSIEQHKPVATFESDGEDDTIGNETISGTSAVPSTTFARNWADYDAWEAWLREL
jgi:DNA processing protein